jgi:hypothetical protein
LPQPTWYSGPLEAASREESEDPPRKGIRRTGSL